jgi:hypothetical protein
MLEQLLQVFGAVFLVVCMGAFIMPLIYLIGEKWIHFLVDWFDERFNKE